MLIQIHPIPAFTDNYIWVFRDSSSNNACVVDPGDAEPVINYLSTNQLNLSHILITHHHPDHTGGVNKLLAEFKPVVYGPELSPFNGISNRLKEGDQLMLFGVQFLVLEVPGHTLDHIAYYADSGLGSSKPVLFCGDTLFAAGCGRIFEGYPAMMYNSLQKLAALDPDTRVYCTHEYTLANLKFAAAAEPDNQTLKNRIINANKMRNDDIPTLPSTISMELATNPFLRCNEDTLINAASTKAGSPPDNAVDVFTILRQWKDNF